MVRFLAIVVAAMMFGGVAKAETLSARGFTDAFAAAAAKALPAAKVAVVADLYLETTDGNGKATTTDLRNAFGRYVQNPAELDTIVRQYVAVLVESVQTVEGAPIDRSHIVPILKSQRWVDGLRQEFKTQKTGQTPEVLIEPLNTELAIVYVEDRPGSMRFLTTRDDVGDRAALRDLALGNLRRLLPKIAMRPGPDGVFIIQAGGNYESSLLLADKIWSSGQIKVDGDIVVAVPAKDVLVVTGSQNAAGIARLHEVAAKFAAAPYGLTATLFVYRDGKFVAFNGG